jgi:cell division protein FtsI (penicillin-binding protein 3)
VITVHEALEHSSDVARSSWRSKWARTLLSNTFATFGFGARTGVELPGETRGLLRPVKRWSGTSIGSIAIGQEVGVTPLQLVSMVSTIANGGVYLPPHVDAGAPGRPTKNRRRLPPQAPQPRPSSRRGSAQSRCRPARIA